MDISGSNFEFSILLNQIGVDKMFSSSRQKLCHPENPDHTVKLENTEVLAVEPKWFERGVKEAIYIRANKPSLNRDTGRYNLPSVWNNTIKKFGPKPKGTRTTEGGGQSSISSSGA